MSITFIKQVLERAVKTAAQAAILALGAGQLDALSADWRAVFGFAAGGFVLSALTSLASLPLSPQGTPSLVDPLPDPPA